jgi:hypothetical protein
MMKSIGEISIAATQSGISGILVVRGAGRALPQEPQLSYPKGRRGPTAPRFSTLLYRPSCRPRPSISVNVGETEIDID